MASAAAAAAEMKLGEDAALTGQTDVGHCSLLLFGRHGTWTWSELKPLIFEELFRVTSLRSLDLSCSVMQSNLRFLVFCKKGSRVKA